MNAGKILRFVSSSSALGEKYAFQAGFKTETCASTPGKVESFLHAEGDVSCNQPHRDLISWVRLFHRPGEACGQQALFDDSGRPRFDISIRVRARLIRTDVEEYLPSVCGSYRYDLYEIIQGEIQLIPVVAPFVWPNVWPKENILVVTLGAAAVQLYVNHVNAPTAKKTIHVRWLPEKDGEKSRYWEMLTCGESDPTEYLRERLNVLQKELTSFPVRLFDQRQSPARVVFQSENLTCPINPAAAQIPRELLVPNVGIEFLDAIRRPSWTPRTVEVDGNRFHFSDRDLFETASTPNRPCRLTWTESVAVAASSLIPTIDLEDLRLTESTAATANTNGIVWHYAPVEWHCAPVEWFTQPGWVGYPLPPKQPRTKSTDSLRSNFSSSVSLPVAVDALEWRFTFAPLADAPVGGIVALEFDLTGPLTAVITLDSEQFDFVLETPELIGYDVELADAEAVPSTTRLGRSLNGLKLLFRNCKEPARIHLAVDSTSHFSVETEHEIYAHLYPGIPLRHFVSPAGENLVSRTAEADRRLEACPDTAAGLVRARIAGAFKIDFPRSIGDELNLGKITPSGLTIDAGRAIHALFPWLENAWAAGGAFAVSERTIFHRNLLLEIAEFFRRMQLQQSEDDSEPIRWTDDQVVEFVRDRFSAAATWCNGESTATPRSIANFLPNASIGVRPEVAVVDEVGSDWPRAEVTLDGAATQILAVKTANGPTDLRWLALRSRVDAFNDAYPSITLEPADAGITTVFQPLIGSTDTELNIYDNCGTVRGYGNGVLRGDGIRLQPVRFGDDDGYFILDCAVAILDDGGDQVRLDCLGLLIRRDPDETGRFYVVTDQAACLGDPGFMRIRGVYAQVPPTVAAYPLIPKFKAADWIELDLADDSVALVRMSFHAYFPSPREVAFPNAAALYLAASAAEADDKLVVVTVPNAAVGFDPSRATASPSIFGAVAWQLNSEATDDKKLAGIPERLEANLSYRPDLDHVQPWKFDSATLALVAFDQPRPPQLLNGFAGGVDEGGFTVFSNAELELTSDPAQKPSYTLRLDLLGVAAAPAVAIATTIVCRRDGHCEASVELTLDGKTTAWELEAIHDRVYGFKCTSPPSDGLIHGALILWHEQQLSERELSYEKVPRQERELLDEQQVTHYALLSERSRQHGIDSEPAVGLIVPGRSTPIALQGWTHLYLIESSKAELSKRFLSAGLTSNDTALPDPLRLVLTSQEVGETVPLMVQFTIDPVDADSGTGSGRDLTGTVLLSADVSDSRLNSLTLEDDVYELMAGLRTQVDRANTDVVIVHEAGSAEQFDLRPIVPSTAVAPRPNFFRWLYTYVPTVNPLCKALDRSHAARLESLEEAPRREYDQPAMSSAPSEAADEVELQSFQNGVAAAISAAGAVFAAKIGVSHGWYAAPGEAPRLINVGSGISTALFSGEDLHLGRNKFLFNHGRGESSPQSYIDFPRVIRSALADPHLQNRLCLQISPILGQSIYFADTQTGRFEYADWGNLSLSACGHELIDSDDGTDHYTHCFYQRLSVMRRRRVLLVGTGVGSIGSEHNTPSGQLAAATTWNDGRNCSYVVYNGSISPATLAVVRTASSDQVNYRIDLPASLPRATSLDIRRGREHFIIAVAYGADEPAQVYVLWDSPGRETPKADAASASPVVRIPVAPARRILLAEKDGKIGVHCFTLSGNDVVDTSHELVPRLSGFLVETTLNFCTDAAFHSPPIDHIQTTPQAWHLLADGVQLMAGMPPTSATIPSLHESMLQVLPAYDSSVYGLVGPVRVDTDRADVYRINAVVSISTEFSADSPDDDLSLTTVTLFGLNRRQIGALYNQTIDPSVYQSSPRINDLIDDLIDDVLKRRSWIGLTVKRTLDAAKLPAYEFLLDATTTPSTAREPAASSTPAPAFDPSNFVLTSATAFGYRPLAELKPGDPIDSNLDDGRRWSVERDFGGIPNFTDTSLHGAALETAGLEATSQETESLETAAELTVAGKTLAELWFGQIAAFDEMPGRAVFPPPISEGVLVPLSNARTPSTSASDQSRPKTFLPTRIHLQHGSGKPGAMISHRLQAVYYTSQTAGIDLQKQLILSPPTTVGLRSSQRIANDRTPNLSDLEAVSLPTRIGTRELTDHRRLKSNWIVRSHPLPVDPAVNSAHDDLYLTRTDNGFFIIKNVGDGYRFSGELPSGSIYENRRIVALVTSVDGELLEAPQFRNLTPNQGRTITRPDDDERSIFVQIRSSDDIPAPQLFLVTRIPNLAAPITASDDRDFKPMIRHSGLPAPVALGELFEPIVTDAAASDIYVWRAKQHPVAWRPNAEVTLYWELDQSTFALYPWSLEKTASNVGTNAGLELRVGIVGDPQSQLVLGIDGGARKNTILAFDRVAGEDLRRDESVATRTLQANQVVLECADRYQAELDVYFKADATLQVVVALPNGAVIGTSTEVP